MKLSQFSWRITISFALAHCALEKGHIIIDLIVARFSAALAGAVGCLTASLSLAIGIILYPGS